MYNVLKEVIKSRRYGLDDMLHKIDIIWAEGNLSDEQRTELIESATANADMSYSLNLYTTVQELDNRVSKLEGDQGVADPVPEKPVPEDPVSEVK